MIWAGMILMGILVLFVALAGVLSKNAKTILSVLPFIVSAVWCIRVFRRAAKSAH